MDCVHLPYELNRCVLYYQFCPEFFRCVKDRRSSHLKVRVISFLNTNGIPTDSETVGDLFLTEMAFLAVDP